MFLAQLMEEAPWPQQGTSYEALAEEGIGSGPTVKVVVGSHRNVPGGSKSRGRIQAPTGRSKKQEENA